MSTRPTAPAQLPPSGIVGLESRWSRIVKTPSSDGVERDWHLLDSWAETSRGQPPELTLLCVHGNPSWSFLWRELITQIEDTLGDKVRVVAVDQLDMGFSERTGQKRTLRTRVNDLCDLTEAMNITGPVITVAHDWGGPISLGWALRHHDGSSSSSTTPARPVASSGKPVLAGVVLSNTAVHQPAASPAPSVIRFIRIPALLRTITVHSRAFIHGAIEMSRPRLPAAVRSGFMAPYRQASKRSAIADFVADIPLDKEHQSASTLDEIATGLETIRSLPALLLWGPRDKVFSDLYLHDLEQRLPQAQVHRFPGAAHFVGEDANVSAAIVQWLEHQFSHLQADQDLPENNNTSRETDVQSSSLSASEQRSTTDSRSRRALSDFSLAHPDSKAIVEANEAKRSLTFAEFSAQIEQLACGMQAFGIRAGDRVAVMILPGIDLVLAVYGCWRLGATLVLVDSGLGPRGMQRALQGANPKWLIGIDKALIAAKLLRWPGKRISVTPRSPLMQRTLRITTDLKSLMLQGKDADVVPQPQGDAIAALAFTSGSTGPSKGVIYRHRQIQAQRDALMDVYQITPDDKLVAAFAPFALYGPTMCITSTVPDMNVAAPGTLTSTALADAITLLDATLVFASPAALVNVCATADAVQDVQRNAMQKVRLVLSAGAPVRARLMQTASKLFTKADFHTPYGMTEMLPVADISLNQLLQIEKAGSVANEPSAAPRDSFGVCVGYPLPGVEVLIDPLDASGLPTQCPTDSAEIFGEIIVRAEHAREGYDRLWLTTHQASQPPGWHRTGDIGTLDSEGRLWVGGRLAHVITSASGLIAPVSSEQSIETLESIEMAAVVGVGPVGKQAVVAVIQTSNGVVKAGEAPLPLIDEIRSTVSSDIDITSVLITAKLPVDRRHNSKVDRSAVAHWAARVLAGERAPKL